MNRRELNRQREQQQAAAEAAALAAQQTAAPAPSNVVPLHASPEPVARVQEAEILPPVTRPAAPVLVVPAGKAAPATGDFVTILQCLSPVILVKTVLANGKTRSAGTVMILPDGTEKVIPPKRFFMLERRLSGPDDLFDLLDKLANERQVAIIRGKWAGETLPTKDEKIYKNKDTFADHPHYWMALDVDHFRPKTADPVLEPEKAIEEYIQAELPECFHYRSCRWNLTASAGLPDYKGVLKARLMFWLKTPYGSDALKAWKIAKGIEVDASLFNPTQFHYTGAPLLEDGVVDPVPVRYGRVKGFEDEVDLVISESLLAQVKVRDRTGGGIDMSDPGERKWFGAAFCRAYDIDRCLEEFGDILPFEFENPGDDRRMNFIDGEHAPGGVFVTPCRNYMISVHGSSPFGSKPTNAFDLIRHYKFGDLDDDDGFDDDHARSTSSLRMQEWIKTLPDVQLELAAEREEQVEAELKMVADNGDEILTQLRTMSPADVEAGWLNLAMDLGPVAEDAVLTEVARVVRSQKTPLKRALGEARAHRDREVREQRLTERADRMGRARVLVEPGDPVRYARQIERLIVDRAQVLERPESFVRFADRLCEVAVDVLPYAHKIGDENAPPPMTYTIRALTRTDIEERLAQVVQVEQMTDAGPRVCDADRNMVTRILELHKGTAPKTRGVVTHPLVLRGGEILATDGLHPGSGLVLVDATVDGCRPYSQDEATAALARVRATVFDGFPFASALDADAALAMLFTGVQRKQLDQAPGFLIQAARQSSGKTTMAKSIHVLLTGRDMPASTMPKDEAEIEKRVFAMLMHSPAMMFFDNVSDGHYFHSESVAAVLSSSEFGSRVLGESETKMVPTTSLFVMTGNNLRLGSDEISRWVTIRLAPKGARPEERHFRYPDILGRMREIRADTLRDVVGIVSGYQLARERVATEMGSRFPKWDRQVRQALLWAGAGDVAHVFRRNTDDNGDVRAREVLLRGLRDRAGGKPFRSKDVCEWCVGAGFSDEENLIHDALEHRGRESRNTRSVGVELQQMLEREIAIDDEVWKLTKVGKDRANLERWAVVQVC